MNLIKVLGGIRKVLGKVTDLLIKGREAGLWNEKNTIPKGRK